ncbi:MAG: sulfatase-like hydrolase/transferase [Firmicutes bacterium]|nr:sulfatase-like hydrolase/transferase [Bacillota bacterium]
MSVRKSRHTVFNLGLGAALVTTAMVGTPMALDSTQHSLAGRGSSIQHVVYIITDNVHYSDIQQMPSVMHFLSQGTVLVNDHTVLDSHTQDGMLSDMTGKYPDQTGVIDQGFYEGSQYVSFAYWENKDPDGQPHVTTTPNWIAFNQHGWNVGAVGAPDMELESAREVTPAMMNPADSKPADYLGIAVHQANGQTIFGSPNLPYLFHAPSWSHPDQTLGGFPGWGDDTDLNWSLQATYEMQTHGVPVTFTYLHEAHEVNGKEALPGQYDATLRAYDTAFSRFFENMGKAGLTASNTLFVLTTDEGDHLMPQGELTTNLTGWLTNNSLYAADPSNLTVYGDSGALVYLKDNRTLPQVLAALPAVPGWDFVANPTELKALHMAVTAALDRTPSFVLFAKPDVYYGYSGSTEWHHNPAYVWNHGTISPDILRIWAGIVGPGVPAHQTSAQWVDHADILPTIYSLLGYDLTGAHFDGIPIASVHQPTHLQGEKLAKVLDAESAFKQLNAPVGSFGMATLKVASEAAVNATNSEGTRLDTLIQSWTQTRDALAAQLQQDILNLYQGRAVSPAKLAQDTDKAQSLLSTVTSFVQ